MSSVRQQLMRDKLIGSDATEGGGQEMEMMRDQRTLVGYCLVQSTACRACTVHEAEN